MVRFTRRFAPVILLLGVATAAPAAQGSRYLYVWAMQTHEPSTAKPPAASMGRDFLAVFDVAEGSNEFGRLVSMLPVGAGAQMAHHTNYSMPEGGHIFASDYMSGDAYVLDVRDPTRPKLAASFAAAGQYTHPHSFERLANGHTLATYQFKGPPDEAAGALVELDDAGRVLRASDASDPDVETFIRPYSLQVVSRLDRVVTTSADMLPADQSSHVLQVWRLSDLKRIRTIRLAKAPHYTDIVDRNAAEPRLLDDGETVLAVTSNCGLYRVAGLAGDDPYTEFIYDFGARACGVATVVGHFWVQTLMSAHEITSLDVSDPAHPKVAGRLTLKGDALPHWIAHEPGGNRLVITGFGWLTTHVLFATIDTTSGALTLAARQIDFDRKWPDGWSGTAMPHGAIFGNPSGSAGAGE
ncbi:MAG TPA: hypothetical protein VN720_09325 [Rudaea sp.]|nr:hypothetical protein [Rudaea sp.]